MKKLLLILPLLAFLLPAQVQLNNARLSNFQVAATGGGGGPSFPSVSGLYAVLIADSLGLSDGSTVTDWVSTNGPVVKDWTNNSAGNTFKANLQNSRAAVQFDGLDGSGLMLSNNFSAAANVTLYIVHRVTVTNESSFRVLASSYATTANIGFRLRVETSGLHGNDYPNVDFQSWGQFATNKLELWTARLDNSGSTTTNWINGAQKNNFGTAPIACPNKFGIGCYWTGSALSRSPDGYIAALVICTNISSEADRTSIESWLTTYYNLQ